VEVCWHWNVSKSVHHLVYLTQWSLPCYAFLLGTIYSFRAFSRASYVKTQLGEEPCESTVYLVIVDCSLCVIVKQWYNFVAAVRPVLSWRCWSVPEHYTIFKTVNYFRLHSLRPNFPKRQYYPWCTTQLQWHNGSERKLLHWPCL